jgi:hypothetical protein
MFLAVSKSQRCRSEIEETPHNSSEPLMPRSIAKNTENFSPALFHGQHRISCGNMTLTFEGDVNESMRVRLDDKVDQWLQNAEVISNCPELFMTSQQTHVPNFVHRIWECREIPDRYETAFKSWVGKTKNMSVFLWTRNTSRQLVLKLEGTEKLMLYDRLLPGAYKADFFRYLLMYKFGGVYSDIDTILHKDLFANDIAHLRDDAVTVAHDLTPSRLLNGAILIAPPGQALFRCALGEVIDHSRRRKKGFEVLDVTGPGVLGECARHILGQDELDFHKNVLDVEETGLRILHSFWLNDSNEHVVQMGNTTELEDRLISLMQGGAQYSREVPPECDPGDHYSVMHSRGQIYSI